MKATALAAIGMFIMLFSISNNDKKYPIVDEINVQTSTVKYQVEHTPLYLKTYEIEERILLTRKLLNEQNTE